MKLLAKVGSLALLAAVAGGVVAGCSGSETKSPGAAKEGTANSVGLALQPVAGVTINTVHFVVTKAGVATPVLEGDLPTSGSASTFNVGLPIPVGTDYTLSLSGVSVESASITCTGSVGPFAVTPNQTTKLTTTFACTDANKGAVDNHVTVTTDACPRLSVDYLVVTPNSANVGSTIGTFSKATDLDGRPITYAWKIGTASVGSFAAATAANTTFTCNGAGTDVPLTITANNGQCSKSLTTTVSCNDVLCGNGVHDPGEFCDPSAGDANCTQDCNPWECGNGVVEVPFEQCDPVPADPGHCTAQCQLRIVHCGDGFLSVPEEQCDGNLFAPGTLPGSTCDATCRVIPPQGTIDCGDGVKHPLEVCDPPLTVNNCGRNCAAISTQACIDCDNASECSDFVDCFQLSGNAAAGTPGAGKPKAQLCNETLDCVRDSGCAAGGNGIIKCYCGTANAADCQNGLANGACKAEIERGLETTAFAQISQRLKSPQFGGGIALARIDCEQQVCKAACGLN